MLTCSEASDQSEASIEASDQSEASLISPEADQTQTLSQNVTQRPGPSPYQVQGREMREENHE